MFPLSTGILAGRLAARYTQRSQFFSKAIRRTMVHWDLAISEKAHHIFWYQLDPIDTVCPPDVDVCLICPYVLPADIYAVKHPEWHDWSRIGQHDTCRGKRSKHMPEFQSNSLHLSSSIDHPHHILPYCPVTPDTYLHSVLQLLYPPLTHTYTASCNYSIPPLWQSWFSEIHFLSPIRAKQTQKLCKWSHFWQTNLHEHFHEISPTPTTTFKGLGCHSCFSDKIIPTFRSHAGKSCSPIWDVHGNGDVSASFWWCESQDIWYFGDGLGWYTWQLTSINNHLIPLYKRCRPIWVGLPATFFTFCSEVRLWH